MTKQTYTTRPIPRTAVTWNPEGFWGKRFQQCAEVTLPWHHARADDRETGHVFQNFRIAAGLTEGEFAGTNWQDEWAYKFIEAACALLEKERNPQIEKQIADLIGLIENAQEPDGYLATQVTARKGERFADPHQHELYTIGHLLTAACAHYTATENDRLINVACRAADYVASLYETEPERLAHFPFNPTLIMGAIDLSRVSHTIWLVSSILPFPET